MKKSTTKAKNYKQEKKKNTHTHTPLLSQFLYALALPLFPCASLALSSKHICSIEIALTRRGNVARIRAQRRPVNVAALDAVGGENKWVDIGCRTSDIGWG
jgi:hypothetical protein